MCEPDEAVVSAVTASLFDFHEGWIYVFGVGIAGGMSLGGIWPQTCFASLEAKRSR